MRIVTSLARSRQSGHRLCTTLIWPNCRRTGERLDLDERYGTLWRRNVSGDEPIVMVEVVNSTREPDGSFKRYWLRVPPDMKTAREAVAWTFNVPAERYAPVKET
jgi:hypothetical protein